MKVVAKCITAMMMVAIVSCNGHHPRGILVEKRHHRAYTSLIYCPTTHMLRPMHNPQKWLFVVQCECGKQHTTMVDASTFERFVIGDSVSAKHYVADGNQ